MIKIDRKKMEESLAKEYRKTLGEPVTKRDEYAYTIGFWDGLAYMEEKMREADNAANKQV